MTTRPPSSLRVVVCRSEQQGGPLIEMLEASGFEVVRFPLIEVTAPLDDGAELVACLDRLGRFSSVVFTSANSVLAVASHLEGRPWPVRTGRAAIGRASARALSDVGLPATFVADIATAESLGATLPIDDDRPVLAPLAELAGDTLRDAIEARGGRIERVTAYRTVTPLVPDDLVEDVRASDLVLLTAPSVADRLVDVLGPGSSIPDVVCIGPSTATAALELGLTVAAIADPHDDAGLLGAVVSTLAP